MENRAIIKPVSYQVTDGLCFKGLSFNVEFSSTVNSESGERCENIECDIPRTVLFLHGWLDNAASFLPLFEECIASNYLNNVGNIQFVAIDLVGHGHSSHRSADAQYHFIDWVYDLLLLIEHNQWQKVDLVGHSMGGMIASMFAAAFPEKTNTLTLIDSLGFFTLAAKHTTKQLRKGLISRLQQVKKYSALLPPKDVENNITPSLRKTQRSYSYPNINAAITARVSHSDLNFKDALLIVERGVIENEHGVTWRSDTRLKNVSPYRLTKEQADQILADITAPILLIYGSEGHEMVPHALANIKSIHESIRCVELDGGHHIHMEQAAKSAKIIHGFLADF